MEYIIENWFVLVGLISLASIALVAVKHFWGLPTKAQIAKVKEWLLYAVTVAEQDLGAGTGQLKLRLVYDMFVARFPLVAKAVSFETFAKWVDEALDEMKKMLATNPAVAALVEATIEAVGTE